MLCSPVASLSELILTGSLFLKFMGQFLFHSDTSMGVQGDVLYTVFSVTLFVLGIVSHHLTVQEWRNRRVHCGAFLMEYDGLMRQMGRPMY